MEERQYEKHAETLVLTEDGINIAAFWLRLLCGCGTDGRFEPIFVMENVIPFFDNSFNYEIAEKSLWKYGEYMPAYYNPLANKIVIRSDVYDGALEGNAMDTITIAHEVVHCIQSIIMRFLDAIKCVDFKTELCKANSSEMKKHEIQTDRITSLVMCPERLVQGKTEDEVVQQYFVRPLVQFMCGLVKTAGKSLLEVLDGANCDVKKEVEACAI